MLHRTGNTAHVGNGVMTMRRNFQEFLSPATLAAMNIILKGFDGHPTEKGMLEEALNGLTIGTCISIANEQSFLPDLRVREHIWISAKRQREAQYDDVDWTAITPLDEERIEQMRRTEAVFVRMIERYARHKDIPYDERKRQYFDHLRYWNDVLTTKRIDLVLMNNVPHQCYDWILYGLCKIKGIRVLAMERCFTTDACYFVEDLDESSVELRDRLVELQREYADPKKPVPLSPKYEEYFRLYSREKVQPWSPIWRKKHFKRKSFVGKWSGTALRLLVQKPSTLTRSVLSTRVWARKLHQHRTFQLYDEHVIQPDLSAPYVYVPLQLQPEATTMPMAGAYVDQERIIQLLAWHLPPGILLYVKEHPAQEELCRSPSFYQSLFEIPSVRFLPRDFDSFALSASSIAIATGTGTAAFEGLFRGKPVLLFGHRFFQYAAGVHLIRTTDDCRQAMEKILHGEKPSARDARLLLKAVEDTGILCTSGLESPLETRTPEEKARVTAQHIRLLVQRAGNRA
ncbi:hypothetical protein HY285_01175 [Candidatus Peregrinibacteria bacterium]|nr:hypothetical protein [Candidatus Peregrinibacteria bacterium]MBI3816139.1 hypothetical protein [Candidatus Peregrinibacteria bacterium]